MENEWLFGFSTSTEERINILFQAERDFSDLTHYNSWRQRKTLLSEADFDILLTNRGLNKYQFNKGISPLNEADLKELFEFVKKQEWFITHKELFRTPVGLTDNLDTALRFHYAYFQSNMKQLIQKFPSINFNSDALNNIKDGVMNDFMQIANKTLVWDVHEIKDRANIAESTPEKEFSAYLQLRFGDAEKTQLFFLEYPTLAKLLATRLKFSIDNFSFFLNALHKATGELETIFGIKPPFILTEYKMGSSDSHHKGKSSILIRINNTNLAFKYRDGQISTRFNQLLSWIETLDSGFKFYKPKLIVSSNFTFEEYISQDSCQSEYEIEEYYTNYGHLLAIIYWLNSTDLHMENLIAHRNFPVLIDIETLLFQEDRRVDDHEITKNKIMEGSSVIKSGLLPLKKYWKRQLEISALSGTKQKLPFKVRKLTNEKSSKINYQLEDSYLSGSKNIPLLFGEEIDYRNYKSFLKKGFIRMNQMLLLHKCNFIQHFKDCFSQCDFRVVLRDTQDYQNFISFATHPSCMINYIEREKIFENLWSCTFLNKSVVCMEIEDLLNNDIPHFITNSLSRRLFSLYTIKENYYEKTALSLSLKHINDISPETIEHSLLLIEESLGDLIMNLQTIEIPEQNHNISNPLLTKASDIGDLILQKILINRKHNLIIWTQLQKDEDGEVKLEYPLSNLYDGTAGLFLFFYYLNHFIPKKSYQDTLEVMEYEVFSPYPPTESLLSAFYNEGCQLTCAAFAYYLNKKDKYLHYMESSLRKLAKINPDGKIEWLYGKASLISVLCFIHETTTIVNALPLIKKLSDSISMEHMDFTGFAHGYSGVLYALTRANKLLSNLEIQKKIESLKKKLYFSLENIPQKMNTSWCHGKIGITESVPELSELINLKIINFQNVNCESKDLYNSCICHGAYGDLEEIIKLYLQNEIDYSCYYQKTIKLIRSPINLMADTKLIPLGLFDGLAGIGYQILRCVSPDSIPSVLFFK